MGEPARFYSWAPLNTEGTQGSETSQYLQEKIFR